MFYLTHIILRCFLYTTAHLDNNVQDDGRHLSSSDKAILEQILAGNDNAHEIASLVGTTPNNVYKTKSELRSMGLIPSQIQKQKQNAVSLSGGDKAYPDRTIHTHASKVGSELTEEQMKILYVELGKGSKAEHIIAKHGFKAEIVEREHERYLRFTNNDRQTLQSDFINHIPDQYKMGEVRTLIDKFYQSGPLTNSEFLDLIAFSIKQLLTLPPMELAPFIKRWLKESMNKNKPETLFDHVVHDAMRNEPQTIFGEIMKRHLNQV